MVLFIWQGDMIGVVQTIDECPERISTHPISPEMAGKHELKFPLSLSFATFLRLAFCRACYGLP